MDTFTIGRRIRLRRLQLGIQQVQLSAQLQAMGFDRLVRQRVNDVEHGRRPIYADELLGVARILRCPPWWLLGMPRTEAMAVDSAFVEPGDADDNNETQAENPCQ